MKNEPKDTRTKNYLIQYDYHYDTHDAEGHQVNKWGTGPIPNGPQWAGLRQNFLKAKIVPKDVKDKPKGAKSGDFLGAVHYADLRKTKDDNKIATKPLHMHALLRLKSKISQKSLMKFLGITRPQNCQPVKDVKAAAKYLLHVSTKAMEVDGKHVYSEADLFDYYGPNSLSARQTWHKLIKETRAEKSERRQTFNDEALAAAVQNATNGLEGQAYEDLALRKKSLVQVRKDFIEKLGPSLGSENFAALKKKFETVVDDYLAEKAESFKRDGRHLTTVMLAGKGGSGKSHLAGLLAYWGDDLHETHVTSIEADKTPDIPDKYAGQNVAVINELTPTALTQQGFFNIFDPYNYGVVPSRNKNKEFLVEAVVLTQAQPLNEWIFDFCTQMIIKPKIFYDLRHVLLTHPTGELYMEASGFAAWGWKDKLQKTELLLYEANFDVATITNPAFTEKATRVLNEIFEQYRLLYPQVGRRLAHWGQFDDAGQLTFKRWDGDKMAFVSEKMPAPKLDPAEPLDEKRNKIKPLAQALGIMREKYREDKTKPE